MTDPACHFAFPAEESLDRNSIQIHQRQKLSHLLAVIQKTNSFYQNKFAGIAFDAARDSIAQLPFTTRKELEADQITHPIHGSNLTYALDQYVRYHQTSGSSGQAMKWLDTADSWNWFKKLWDTIYAAAHVERRHRILFPFSFGPFVGFWAAFDGASSRGNMVLAAGAMTTTARLKMMIDNQVDVVCCTPTYALRMVDVAREEKIDLPGSTVKKLIVAGEAGGSIPEIRKRIEEGWGARVYDHTGMTEMGAVGFECHERPGGVHINEAEFIAEVIHPQTLEPVAEGEQGELVLTNLGRLGSPLIRYRTNDLVKITRNQCGCGRWFCRMEGGILGRIDDMITVRGNNVFPAGIEAVIRRFDQVAEFRVHVVNNGPLGEILIDLEPTHPEMGGNALCQLVESAIQNALSFRATARCVACGSLPRFEMKSRRFIRETT